MSAPHDPWERVRALRPNPYSHSNYYVAEEVDAARAADAARHQQEIAALTQERDALLNYYWKANHLAGNVELEAAEARCAILTAALEELYATVKGECPSLLNEDSGGSAQLDAQVSAALAAAPQGGKP